MSLNCTCGFNFLWKILISLNDNFFIIMISASLYFCMLWIRWKWHLSLLFFFGLRVFHVKNLCKDEKTGWFCLGLSNFLLHSWMLISCWCCCRVHEGRKLYQIRESSQLSSERILCIGSSRKRPVIKWENNMALPGKLTLTDKALYFEVFLFCFVLLSS